MQPIEHFDARVAFEPVERSHPWLENLDTANRTVRAPLARGNEARGPGRADAADEDEARIARGRHFGGDFGGTNFVFANHRRPERLTCRSTVSHAGWCCDNRESSQRLTAAAK
jgi:hypothetical protein